MRLPAVILVAAALLMLAFLAGAIAQCQELPNLPGLNQQDPLAAAREGRELLRRGIPESRPLEDFKRSKHCTLQGWKPGPMREYRGTVKRVIDGDTLVAVINGRETTVRLWGIDAPETSQLLGTEATQALKALAPQNTSLELHAHGADTYGRLLAVAGTGDGLAINARLVQQGLAFHYPRGESRGHTCLGMMQMDAGMASKGVWSGTRAVIQRPWLHRASQD